MNNSNDSSNGSDPLNSGGDEPEADKAASALELLRSLSSARASPENLEQAFLDWTRLYDEARAYPDFESLLTSLFEDNHQPVRNLSQNIDEAPRSIHRYDISDVFFADEHGSIIDIDTELATLLNLKVGDALEPAIFQELHDRYHGAAEPKLFEPTTIEVRDSFDLKRRIVLHRISQTRGAMRYAAVYIRVTLSESAEVVLRDTYKLTKSELEILGLALQRFTPEHIARIRNSKLNTVRTHISRFIQKTDCHSLNEAIGFALELSLATESDVPVPFGRTTQSGPNDRKISIPEQNAVVDYSRYGPPSGKPVVVLHSLEYGFEPTQTMIEAARARNICLYFPRRSGFGGTTAANTLADAAMILDGFLSALDLSEVSVVALSTAAPQALAIPNSVHRISQMILVNYGLDAKGKIEMFEPAWIRGLIKMGLAAPASFAAGVEVIRSFWRTFGTERLFRMLYSSVESDLKFLEENIELFENSSDIIYRTSRANIRIDIVSSFLENRELTSQIAHHSAVLVANGERYFTEDAETLRANANAHGVEMEIVQGLGRNWIFSHPAKLFELVESEVRPEH